jgi:hypothetical protein
MKTQTSCPGNHSGIPRGSHPNARLIGGAAAGGVTLLLLLAVGGVAGCGKKDKPPEIKPEQVAPINPESPAEAQQKARLQQAVAIREGIEPPPPAIKLRGGELATPEVIAAYNQELLRYIVRTKDTPESLQELMRIRELPRLPTPPPGKRIVYDPVNRIIKLYPP